VRFGDVCDRLQSDSRLFVVESLRRIAKHVQTELWPLAKARILRFLSGLRHRTPREICNI
jgi:hypothetical protein